MRYFELLNPLTIPRRLSPGMGNTHKRPSAGDAFSATDLACSLESRFVRGRIRAKDMKEIDEAAYNAIVAVKVAQPEPMPAPSKPSIVTGAPTPVAATVTTEQPAAPAKAK